MANKLIVTQHQLDVIKRHKPDYMTQEKFDQWIEDNVELLKNIDEEETKVITNARLSSLSLDAQKNAFGYGIENVEVLHDPS
ncbi:MAG TPA: hypothetical protein PKD16_02310 [Saprospiraceae bacterium]|jgi:truncated hemoglobin YjbI|nr:hypothetical protein [Saprospiraceae bacterium]